MNIINKGSHTSQTFRTAYILLNYDEGKYSQKVTYEQVSKVAGLFLRNKVVSLWQILNGYWMFTKDLTIKIIGSLYG